MYIIPREAVCDVGEARRIGLPLPFPSGGIRRFRTGRNVQFNAKASQETVDAIYGVTEAHPGWVLGYTLERAIAALQRELESDT